MNPNEYPRDPAEYDFSQHFEEDTLPDEMRFLTKEMVEETIREGRDCVRALGEPIRRKKTYHGVDAVVVLGSREGLAVLTGWTEVNKITDALKQDSPWDMEEIETIQELDYRNQAKDSIYGDEETE